MTRETYFSPGTAPLERFARGVYGALPKSLEEANQMFNPLELLREAGGKSRRFFESGGRDRKAGIEALIDTATLGVGPASVGLASLFKTPVKKGTDFAQDAIQEAFNPLGASDNAVPVSSGQKLYRYEKPNYSGSSEGAIFYTPDKSYAELYKGEDSVLKTAQTPENFLDIRLEKDREKVKPFLENEYNRLKNKSDNYEIDRVSSELNFMKKNMDRNDAQGVSGALANLNLIYMKEQGLSKLPVGMSEKRLMDNLGVNAMTIKESGRDVNEYSVAFREVPNNVQGKAQGGVVSLRDEARDMFRKPKGIASLTV
jgi:hypothetical protein